MTHDGQLEIFEPTTMSRRDDPETSKEAAEKYVECGRHKRSWAKVLMIVCQYPGSTAAEMAFHGNYDRHEMSRRLPELERKGLVLRGEARRCRVTKNKSATWRVDDASQRH